MKSKFTSRDRALCNQKRELENQFRCELEDLLNRWGAILRADGSRHAHTEGGGDGDLVATIEGQDIFLGEILGGDRE